MRFMARLLWFNFEIFLSIFSWRRKYDNHVQEACNLDSWGLELNWTCFYSYFQVIADVVSSPDGSKKSAVVLASSSQGQTTIAAVSQVNEPPPRQLDEGELRELCSRYFPPLQDICCGNQRRILKCAQILVAWGQNQWIYICHYKPWKKSCKRIRGLRQVYFVLHWKTQISL